MKAADNFYKQKGCLGMKGLEVELDGIKYFVTAGDGMFQDDSYTGTGDDGRTFGVTVNMYLKTMRSKVVYTEVIKNITSKQFNLSKAKKFIKRSFEKR